MREALLRSNDAMIAGVCAGLAAHLGVSVNVARIGMVGLALAGGAGIFLYGWLWVLVPTQEEQLRKGPTPVGPRLTFPKPPEQAEGTGAATTGQPDGLQNGTQSWIGKREVLLGTALLLVAAVAIAQQLGANLPLDTLLPVGVVAAGAVLAWTQLDESRRAGLMNRAGASQAGGLARLVAGLLLVTVGVLILVSGSIAWEITWSTLIATGAVLAGVFLVLAPWGLKFWRDLETERSGRARETERAEIAAHLHDSVLQTLALIQNRAGSEQDVIRLARAQERELRNWLYADATHQSGNLAERIRAMAAEIEDSYGTPINVVVVGDTELSAQQEVLAQAAREAVLNAAKHAGGNISVYLEAGPTGSTIFVRDRGSGFDPDAVPADRMGIRVSLYSRMHRHGGDVSIRSNADGTEVKLVMPENVADGAQ
ncbi:MULTISPECIES: ATP-binding protein [unclassified Arthrobacter]|uniref:ATP-binding protein n=1 Tax=unclassified Arthrobacter TaxID=235627 RepID=UPI001492AEB8|nr:MULTISPECIES: ATP-binding protein [unclassified Arthrobacter]MBE0008747.1 ATP-binding protein [Arthrobacter sp. AET 35A]NOJ62773.1 PspC domain-containing protein [Arthrobacter sp. 147(2020)]